ncbi:putative membrane fusion protein [Caloranaerobacter azorensis DSM 13643]|uniref:Putative membrane fusion protein n=1 Tax=Caloranaerobacter azorensis DSM 13643 TaxID=1121264 RepID=A0A1M5V393_9FIRM|nr:HlyD family efflux transporter periplasmic adaptor subunit [Caloranaerobacter azorensis]SHH69433.1 putative membrane fusion protein [Caloranaerobacter azorensis DSM 13643]
MKKYNINWCGDVMTKDKRKQKRKRRKKLRIGLVIIVMIYLSLRMLPTFCITNAATVVVEEGSIDVLERTKGIIFKNEVVYRATTNGKIIFNKNEGEKVGLGILIGQVIASDKNHKIAEELNAINKKIEELSNKIKTQEIFSNDIEKNKIFIDEKIDTLRKSILEGNFIKVNQVVKELKLDLDKRSDLFGKNSLIANDLDKLYEMRKNLQNRLKNAKENYYSKNCGLVSYTIDGLEEIYNLKGLSKFTPDKFRIIESNIHKINNELEVSSGEPIFKIIDNYKWYLVVKLGPNSGIDRLSEGKYVYIKFLEKNEKIKGKVYKVNKGSDGYIVIFEFDSYLYKFYNERYVDVEIIINTYSGLKVPKSSVVKRDGIDGVYIKDISGVVKFKPVRIIGQNDKYVIVDTGSKIKVGDRGKIKININGKDEKVYTISIFDEVFVNGKKVKEGQIID